MKQYFEIKSLHQDKILFFRMGDFYELFYEDAQTAAPLIGLVLTQRNKKSGDQTPMCGFPYHSVAGPINKLLSYGYKIAICDQLEDPKFAKGLVKRGVTRILTPGMVFDPESLDGYSPNYMASFCDNCLALADLTTGEAFYFDNIKYSELINLTSSLPIAEWVIDTTTFQDYQNQNPPWPKNITPTDITSESSSSHSVLTSASPSTNKNPSAPQPKAVWLLIAYSNTLISDGSKLLVTEFQKKSLKQYMQLGLLTATHLELFQTYQGQKQGSFFQAINKTLSPMGARLLRDWVLFPLYDFQKIKARQDQMEYWFKNNSARLAVRSMLNQVGDLERRLAKLSQSGANAKDVLSLKHSLDLSLQILEQTPNSSDDIKNNLTKLSQLIEQTLIDDPPLSTKNGHLIRKGVNSELDEYIVLTTDANQILIELENREKQSTGINSLKIRYNQVFGYYIEITHTNKDKVPSHYMRKQTLTQSERYYTQELADLEKKIIHAQTKRFDLEFVLFEELRQKILSHISVILKMAQHIAHVDVLISGATLVIDKKYNFPTLIPNSKTLKLLSCRHPVVEQSVDNFTSNDIVINSTEVLLLTGPNMAGKSTLMRQVALNVLLAQMGYPVACEQAYLPLFDGIFTRIGASDQLSQGLSTFMVEMKEASYILSNITENSLVIFDEIGRGTSTFDGLSLAQAILEYLLNHKKSYTLFATHYHELTHLEFNYPKNIINSHMSIKEAGQEIIFLHTLVRGPTHKSYGIHVAQLAGLPKEIIKKAQSLIKRFENNTVSPHSPSAQMDLFSQIESLPPTPSQDYVNLIEDLQRIEINQITPIQALTLLAKLKEQASHLNI